MNANHTHSSLARSVAQFSGIAGIALLMSALGLALATHDGVRQFLHAYLLNFVFVLSISLGALVFVLLHHVTSAGWSVLVRRISEILAANVTTCALLAIPILLAAAFGHGALYEWTSREYLAVHPQIAQRWFYPNLSWFLLRLAVCFAAWIGIAVWFLRRSVEQDRTGDPNLSARMKRFSAPALVITGFAIAFAAFDLLMSLDPTWISTIFGVYYFAGGMVGFFAVLILLIALLQRRGALTNEINREHYHDLGKYLFAFLFFGGYIAFSQYMLIWYGNIPEETAWFVRRGASTASVDFSGWSYIALLILLGHLLIPFAALLSRFGKRRTGLLCALAGWLLITHWFDLFWLVAPEYQPSHSSAGLSGSMWLLSLLCLGGIGGLYICGAARLAASLSLVPLRDPRLDESIQFQNL